MKKIDELLAIDKFEKARMNTKALKNKCLSFMSEKDDLLKGLEADESLRKIEIIKREFVELKEKEEGMNKQLEDVVRRKVITARDMMILKEQQRKMQTIEEDTKKYSALIELTEADIEKIKTDLVEFAEKTTEELNDESKKVGEDIERLSFSIGDEKANLDKLKEEYAEENAKIRLIEEERLPKARQDAEEFESISEKLKKNPVKKVESELKASQKEMEKTQLNTQKSLAKISELEDSIHELSLAGSICPVCNSKLTESKKSSLLSKDKKLLEELNKSVESSKKMTEKLQEEINKLNAKFREAERLEERFDQVKDSRKQLRALSNELDNLKDKVKVFLNQKKMFEKNI
jgi:hypothetical protein